jgi:hypothetical protein
VNGPVNVHDDSRPNFPGRLVIAQAQESRMTRAVVGCPFNESDLCEDLGLRPLHLRHFLCRDAAPHRLGLGPGRLAKGHFGTRTGLSFASTSRRTKGTNPARTLPANCKASPS